MQINPLGKTLIRSSLLIVLLSACSGNTIYSEYEGIPLSDGWAMKDVKKFNVDITDTQNPHDIFVHIRNAEGYPYRNLFLFLHTTYPDGKKITDTLECMLANEKGEWLGSGAGDLWDNKIVFKKNVKFPAAGKYTFEYEQAMRYGDANFVDPLPLILDVGLSIEKVE